MSLLENIATYGSITLIGIVVIAIIVVITFIAIKYGRKKHYCYSCYKKTNSECRRCRNCNWNYLLKQCTKN